MTDDPEPIGPIGLWLVDQLRPIHLRKEPPVIEIAPEDRAAWLACLDQLGEPATDSGEGGS